MAHTLTSGKTHTRNSSEITASSSGDENDHSANSYETKHVNFARVDFGFIYGAQQAIETAATLHFTVHSFNISQESFCLWSTALAQLTSFKGQNNLFRKPRLQHLLKGSPVMTLRPGEQPFTSNLLKGKPN